MSRAHVADDVQLLAAVTRRLVIHDFARSFAGLGCRRLAFPLSDLSRLNFSDAARFFLGGALAIFFITAPPTLFFLTLAIQPLLLESLGLRALDSGLGLLLGLAKLVDLFLLMARLILKDFALHVGALAAHLDIHRSRTALRACEFQLRLRFAAQRNLARRCIALGLVVTVTAAQVRQQLMLGVFADHVFSAVDFDAGLIQLLQQPIDRNLQHLSELSDGYICHTCS